MTRTLAFAALSFALLPLAASAQSSPAPTPAVLATAAPAPCVSPQDRQFDFWAGRWTVTDHATGRPAGTNDVTRELRSCVLMEHWKGQDGSVGMSFNHYDATRKLWHQTWVDNSGGILYLDGGLKNGSMVLSGKRTGRNGRIVTDRITWTPQPDGAVRQWWQVTRDGGKSWSTLFDGIYRRSS